MAEKFARGPGSHLSCASEICVSSASTLLSVGSNFEEMRTLFSLRTAWLPWALCVHIFQAVHWFLVVEGLGLLVLPWPRKAGLEAAETLELVDATFGLSEALHRLACLVPGWFPAQMLHVTCHILSTAGSAMADFDMRTRPHRCFLPLRARILSVSRMISPAPATSGCSPKLCCLPLMSRVS